MKTKNKDEILNQVQDDGRVVSRLIAATSGSCTRGVLDSLYKLDTKEGRLRAVLDEGLRIEVAATDSSLARNRWE